jgi:glyoxylase-like metal-dependent hydrolase (beta-lactamase superfamily II)
MREFLPVPEFAQGPKIPESGYLVTDLGGGAYGITSGGVNTMFLVVRNGVVVVDAPLGLGEKLLRAIEEVTPKPVTHLIYSHAHADHIGAAHLIAGAGVKIVAHEFTAQFLRQAQDHRRPVPDEVFTGANSELTVDGERMILDYPGNWHQPGNLFIHLPEQKVLTAIDTFTVKHAPFSRLLFTPHLPTYLKAMDQMLEYDFETVVSGHLSLYGTREDVQTNREYLHDLRTSVAEALRTVDRGEAAAVVPDNNRQAMLKVWMDAVVARAAELMPSAWKERLGGTDIFLADNLNTIGWSLVLD